METYNLTERELSEGDRVLNVSPRGDAFMKLIVYLWMLTIKISFSKIGVNSCFGLLYFSSTIFIYANPTAEKKTGGSYEAPRSMIYF
jgi:hypothetical protein